MLHRSNKRLPEIFISTGALKEKVTTNFNQITSTPFVGVSNVKIIFKLIERNQVPHSTVILQVCSILTNHEVNSLWLYTQLDLNQSMRHPISA